MSTIAARVPPLQFASGASLLTAIAVCWTVPEAFAESGPDPAGALLARYPIPARVVCDETMTEGGATVSDRTEEKCRVEGARIVCASRSLTHDEALGTGEERIDAQGIWTVGNDVYRLDPPILTLPADIAPGKRWTVETDMVMSGPEAQRLRTTKRHEVEASDRCAGGLLIKTERQGRKPGSARVLNELLLCPGMSTAREYVSRTYQGETLIRTISATCRAE